MSKVNTASSPPRLNPALFAGEIKKGIDKGHVPQTEARLKALARYEPSVQQEVLKELDKQIAKEDAKRYYDELARLAAKNAPAFAPTLASFVQAQAAKLETPRENTTTPVDMRAAVSATAKKPAADAASTEPIIDGLEKIQADVEATNADAKKVSSGSPAAAKAVERKADEAMKVIQDKLAAASLSITSQAERLKATIGRLLGINTPESIEKANQGKAALSEIVKNAIGTPLQAALEAIAKKKDEPIPPPNVEKPAAGSGLGAVFPTGATTELKPDTQRQLQKALAEVRDTNRSTQILALINSNLPIEYILLAVMLLLFDDSDEKLRQKLKEQQLNQEEMNALRKQMTALENRDPKAMEALGADVASLSSGIQAAQTELASLSAELDRLTKEGGTPPPPPAAETPPAVESPVAKVAEEVVEARIDATKETLDQVGDITAKRDEKAEDTKKKDARKVEAGESSGHEVNNTPEAKLDQQKATTAKTTTENAERKEATETNEAEGQSAKVDAGKPQADTSSLPQADVGAQPVDIETLRKNKLNQLETEIREREGSVTKFNFEVQGLMDNRKQMLELVSKLLAEISQMISTIINNIR